jgi:uncharacterized protein (TIGR02421 family)
MSVDEIDLAIDRRLSEICSRLPMLHLLTPINVTEARSAFLEGEIGEPEFRYRELPDLDAIGDELAEISPEDALDPILAHIVRDTYHDLERRLELLRNRGTERFRVAAVEEYGYVDQGLLDLALLILDSVPAGPRTSRRLTAEEVAARADRELDHYRSRYPELSAMVHVGDTLAGVMVENGDLFIGSDTTVAVTRIDQLLQHEIGVHILTHVNGSAQPIRMLALGLAGYEATQEALGVLAEHLSGGLAPGRLRVLALRVIAAHSVTEGAEFGDTHRLLESQGAGKHLAFTTTMRAHRSGGMTKDALYLAGLTRLLDHLRVDGQLEPLLVGKISLAYEPLIAELLDRGVLVEPPLMPRFLESEAAIERLARIRSGESVIELGGVAA